MSRSGCVSGGRATCSTVRFRNVFIAGETPAPPWRCHRTMRRVALAEPNRSEQWARFGSSEGSCNIGLLDPPRLSAAPTQRRPGSVSFVPVRCCDPEGVLRLAPLAQERCPGAGGLPVGRVGFPWFSARARRLPPSHFSVRAANRERQGEKSVKMARPPAAIEVARIEAFAVLCRCRRDGERFHRPSNIQHPASDADADADADTNTGTGKLARREAVGYNARAPEEAPHA